MTKMSVFSNTKSASIFVTVMSGKGALRNTKPIFGRKFTLRTIAIFGLNWGNTTLEIHWLVLTIQENLSLPAEPRHHCQRT